MIHDVASFEARYVVSIWGEYANVSSFASSIEVLSLAHIHAHTTEV